MNRIDQKFKDLKKKKKKAFIAFITAGDPDLKTTEALVLAFEKAGVDIVELGVPFSDPMADGPTIQAASQRALDRHINLEKILQLVKRLRTKTEIPIALMTYYNPVFHYGDARFVAKAKQSGVDGIIVPDLPPEEAARLIKEARSNDIASIFFLAPTTKQSRVAKIANASTGFIYYVSITGVTGANAAVPNTVRQKIKEAKQYTQKPICVGFGVSTPAQVKAVAQSADGVIVGSAIINKIQQHAGKKTLVPLVAGYVNTLVKSLR